MINKGIPFNNLKTRTSTKKKLNEDSTRTHSDIVNRTKKRFQKRFKF